MKNTEYILKTKTDTPFLQRLERVVANFSETEKWVFSVLFLITLCSSISVLWKLNSQFLVEVPKHGGRIVEGVISYPRFINPLLEISDADRDLSSLVYSGLMKPNENGDLIPDLAKDYSISEDGLIYTFRLKDEVYFHDGEEVTSEDIFFTIEKAKDPTLKSPKRANWDGVDVEITSAKEIQFILRQPYSPFLENTTIGILPEHIWKEVASEQFVFSKFNTEPIGSGPFRIKEIKQDNSGIPRSYTLSSFKNYSLGQPYINELELRFYPSEKELLIDFNGKNIENINSIVATRIGEINIEHSEIKMGNLPRVFGVFLNQNKASIFTNKNIREALNLALDKEKMVKEVFSSYGKVIDGPIPPGALGRYEKPDVDIYNPNEAIALLEADGFSLDEETGIMTRETRTETTTLSFSLSTANIDELKKTAEMIKTDWKKIGVDLTVKIFEPGNLNQEVIRPREYESLLFGEIIGRDLDLFAFWHSSQRNDPGLNIALYANITTDKLLEEGRQILSKKDRVEKYKQFEEEIKKETPAVFLYSPEFIYIVKSNIEGINLGTITTSSDRFMDVHSWYIDTDKVWDFFEK